MTGLVFVDTNVLVYRHDTAEPSKQSRADAWINLVVRNRAGRQPLRLAGSDTGVHPRFAGTLIRNPGSLR